MTLPISPLPPESLAAAKALARAAFLFRGLFTEAAMGRPIRGLIDERSEAIELANDVLDRWLDFLAIDPETGDDLGG